MAKLISLIAIVFAFVSCCFGRLTLEVPNQALDQQLYQDVLDPELCEEQLNYIVQNDTLLRAAFLDAGIRTPRGILQGNFADMGNYYQCLEISQDIGDSVVEGKYCTINVPLDQEFELPTEWPELPDFPWPELLPNSTISAKAMKELGNFEVMRRHAEMLSGSVDDPTNRAIVETAITGPALSLAVCIPKTCTTDQALAYLLYNLTSLGIQFNDDYCRLPNDKPWSPADYIAVVFFSILGLLTAIGTVYDVNHNVLRKKDPKTANVLLKAFSVYTNCRRLITFTSTASTLECLDGIRVLAMMWVIVGHTFSMQLQIRLQNPVETLEWIRALSSVWIIAGPITVDTFFMFSGLLLVYTTVGKIGHRKFLSNIPLFYLNRLLRLFPLLALGVLLTASTFNRVTDGPYWSPMVRKAHKCRTYWWATLLHIQNYVGSQICLDHTWYLAIDIQLHIISPLFIFWMLGAKRVAWMALTAGLIISLSISTTINFINNFPSAMVTGDLTGVNNYLWNYYINTLTRASPFFVGMIFGFLLVQYKEKRILLKPYLVGLFWTLATLTALGVIFITYPIYQLDWDNQLVNNLVNSFMRPAWAAAVAWMIFSCHQGYGGLLNWFLSLRMWKLPARLSYAMYIFHYPIIIMMNSTNLAPYYFSESALIYRFFADFSMSLFVAFLATLLVDAPCSTLIKLAVSGGSRKPLQKKEVVGKPHENIIFPPDFKPDKKTRL